MEPMVGSHLRMHENFRRLRQLARQSHERGRATAGIDSVSDDQRALISTFHFYCTHVERAAELLMELGNQLPSPVVATQPLILLDAVLKPPQ